MTTQRNRYECEIFFSFTPHGGKGVAGKATGGDKTPKGAFASALEATIGLVTDMVEKRMPGIPFGVAEGMEDTLKTLTWDEGGYSAHAVKTDHVGTMTLCAWMTECTPATMVGVTDAGEREREMETE